MPYKGSFLITKCWYNDMVTLHCGAIKIRYAILRIKPYTFDTNAEVIKYLERVIDDVTSGKYQLYTSVFTLNLGTEYINRIRKGTLTNIHIHIINMP